MRIIEIAALSNGAHRNQSHNGLTVVPAGWAIIPVGMDTPNFPFGDIAVETINGVSTVTNWTAGVLRDAEPQFTPAEQREAAYNTQAVIAWEGEQLTVTQAAQLWLYYAAEGDTDQAAALTSLIAQAKRGIRVQLPDEEGTV